MPHTVCVIWYINHRSLPAFTNKHSTVTQRGGDYRIPQNTVKWITVYLLPDFVRVRRYVHGHILSWGGHKFSLSENHTQEPIASYIFLFRPVHINMLNWLHGFPFFFLGYRILQRYNNHLFYFIDVFYHLPVYVLWRNVQINAKKF